MKASRAVAHTTNQHVAAEQHVDEDLDKQVAEYSKLYSIDQWLQPRSMVQVQLARLKEETRCPMCFGKIRSARISMVCLHRYCAKCIEQYLRAKVPGRHGDDKECPVCRAHLHSRRATKPDPVFDKIIKALYGDVDQFDKEEEALIEADNKRHVAVWQAQLAEMKARQAAAVAAARNNPSGWEAAPSKAQQRKRSWGNFAHSGEEDTDEDEDLKYAYGTNRSGAAAASGGSRGAKAARLASAGGSRNAAAAAQGNDEEAGVAVLLAGLSNRSKAAAGAGSKKSAAAAAAAAAAEDGDANAAKGSSVSPLGSPGSFGPKKKKKRSTRNAAARLLGLAAQAAAAAPPPVRCCVVHLQPVPKQQPAAAEGPSAAADGAAAGRPEGRSRKAKGSKGKGDDGHEAARQPLHQLMPGQTAAPSIDQPFLACPWDLTIFQLKQLLQQQLHQQGTVAGLKGCYELQLLQPPKQPAAAAAAAPVQAADAGSSRSILRDELTMGQLHEQAGCLGPDVLINYQLLGL